MDWFEQPKQKAELNILLDGEDEKDKKLMGFGVNNHCKIKEVVEKQLNYTVCKVTGHEEEQVDK